MTKNNKGNLFVFEVGPSVKFVSAIIYAEQTFSVFFVQPSLNLVEGQSDNPRVSFQFVRRKQDRTDVPPSLKVTNHLRFIGLYHLFKMNTIVFSLVVFIPTRKH